MLTQGWSSGAPHSHAHKHRMCVSQCSVGAGKPDKSRLRSPLNNASADWLRVLPAPLVRLPPRHLKKKLETPHYIQHYSVAA